MMRLPFMILVTGLGLAGCATPGDRGLTSPHQPIVTENSAHVPNCPDWSGIDFGEREGQSSNFGCSAAINLAAMVADPADLLRGRDNGAASGSAETASRAIKALRAAPPTGHGGTTVEKINSKATSNQ